MLCLIADKYTGEMWPAGLRHLGDATDRIAELLGEKGDGVVSVGLEERKGRIDVVGGEWWPEPDEMAGGVQLPKARDHLSGGAIDREKAAGDTPFKLCAVGGFYFSQKVTVDGAEDVGRSRRQGDAATLVVLGLG